MNDDYNDGSQQRRHGSDGGDDGGEPKPGRRLPEPRNVDGLLSRVDRALDPDLHREYRQEGGE